MIKITIPIIDHSAHFLTPEGEENETAYYFVEYKLNEDKIYTSFQSFTDRIIIGDYILVVPTKGQSRLNLCAKILRASIIIPIMSSFLCSCQNESNHVPTFFVFLPVLIALLAASRSSSKSSSKYAIFE